jgi:hypothetical protein
MGGRAADAVPLLGRVLLIALAAHLVILAFEHILSPSPTRHHEMAVETFRRGAYSQLFWGIAVIAGGFIPIARCS